MRMEQIYERNFKLINKYGISVGTTLRHKENRHKAKVVAINPHYGWVVTVYNHQESVGEVLKQDLSNINKFEPL